MDSRHTKVHQLSILFLHKTPLVVLSMVGWNPCLLFAPRRQTHPGLNKSRHLPSSGKWREVMTIPLAVSRAGSTQESSSLAASASRKGGPPCAMAVSSYSFEDYMVRVFDGNLYETKEEKARSILNSRKKSLKKNSARSKVKRIPLRAMLSSINPRKTIAS